MSDEEPKSVNTVADVAMDDAEKMLRNPSTDRADSKGLQDLAKEDHEAENELGGCPTEADPGRMAHQSEPHPLPAKQVERSDRKELSVCDGSTKTRPSVKNDSLPWKETLILCREEWKRNSDSRKRSKQRGKIKK